MVDFDFKDNYNINDLIRILEILRGENGCPWDAEQTHESIRSNMLEEAYEVADAIDEANSYLQEEELGDVLLQVVFHCQIEKETTNNYDFESVCNAICQKLIVRHPHVFGDVVANDSQTVLKNWDNIKKESKNQSYTQTLKDIPKSLPALMRAEKIGKRASRANMDFADAKSSLQAVMKEANELESAIESENMENIKDELGDLLFSCVNTARKLGVDAEEALSFSCAKFINRFEKTEELVKSDNLDMTDLDEDELNAYWDKCKKEFGL